MFVANLNMNKEILRSKSVTELLEGMRLGKPNHPQIAIVDTSKLAYGEEFVGMRFSSDLYCIALKDAGCGIDYGRNHYDFTKGALIFTSPGQVFKVRKAQRLNQSNGWMLYFHADLIRNTSLGARIDNYNFFDYDVHEALHLSDQEEATLTNIVQLIQEEISQRIDNYSQQVLVSHIELILNYSVRFFERQMNTRSAQHTDILSRVEISLKSYYQNNDLVKTGPPTIQYLADTCHLSQSYLSDVLSKETGMSARDHINNFLIEKAKHKLLSSTDTVSGIAYSLGFNYPHYFSRLFKQKTGLTPQKYRQSTS